MPTPTKGPRLGGSPAHEKALIANLARALFEHGRITTTLTKAKRLRPRAEHLITFAKKGDLASRRQVLRVVRDKDVVYKLFDEIAPRFADRQGGYTRILKLGPRQGDNAPMALIELVEQAAPAAATEAATEAPERRRRFGRRRDAQEAPAGANRAQRRAAARGKLAPVPEHDHDHDEDVEEGEAAEAAEATAVEADEDERPAVPTDDELAAGAAPVVEEDDEEDDGEAEDEAEDEDGERAATEADAEADGDDDEGEEPGDGAKKSRKS